ncbi:MAG: helix-hairpin-helix domain-containing protein [Gammaproteobacteria bacterium]|nr:helix-hairpin-helix domain-containing protein [Gammaproteobacteria bacterium]
MGFNTLLLLGIIWLLWTIHEDLSESNDRQRSLKTSLNQLASRLDRLLGTEKALSEPAAQAAARVDLNTASKAKLQTLPRIGAVTAEQIIAARPYQSVADLSKVAGITKAILAEIEARVTV